MTIIGKELYGLELHRGAYSVSRDRFGHYLIVRLADCADVYLQGDDAVQFEPDFEGCEAAYQVDQLCSNYDDVMEV